MKKRTATPRKKSPVNRIPQRSRKTSHRKVSAASKVSAGQKSAGANRSEGIRLFQLVGRPTAEQFIRVYGERGPKMTWEERAAAGIPAEKFRSALAAAMRKWREVREQLSEIHQLFQVSGRGRRGQRLSRVNSVRALSETCSGTVSQRIVTE